MVVSCPKCQYARREFDSRTHPDICPQCGIVYSKWVERQQQAQEDIDISAVEQQTFTDWLTEPPEQVDSTAFWSRAICAGLFFVWTMKFFFGGISFEGIMGSFLHPVNLVFHEFGHLFFRPFGEFMTILGGSLFQVLWPWTFLIAFLFKYRDTFAASLMLWWSGQNFVDLAPYIADAYYRALPLVGGGGEESHDWGNILTRLGVVEHHMRYANWSFYFGILVMLGALYWSGIVLKRQWQIVKQSEQ